jgi:dual specificity phosphatase 3
MGRITEVYPRVFFGEAGLTHRPEIAEYTHIVNCDSRKESTGSWARAERTVLWLQSFDEPDYPILSRHLAAMTTFVDDALVEPNARIYIHCLAGINRSATLAIAYACSKTGTAAADMIQELRMRSGRFIVGNGGFEEQLCKMFPTAEAQI